MIGLCAGTTWYGRETLDWWIDIATSQARYNKENPILSFTFDMIRNTKPLTGLPLL